jgi:hypothetical protein
MLNMWEISKSLLSLIVAPHGFVCFSSETSKEEIITHLLYLHGFGWDVFEEGVYVNLCVYVCVCVCVCGVFGLQFYR